MSPVEEVLDRLIEDDGRQLLYMTLFNYAHGNLDDVREMLLSPHSVIGLSDAGAHCGAICDGSFPTTALSLWTRRAEGLPIELMVHHVTQRTARQVGWLDRGVLAPGHLGDVNVIDVDALAAHRPHIVHDLPAGGRRLMQSASGYVHTIKRRHGDVPRRRAHRRASPAPSSAAPSPPRPDRFPELFGEAVRN